MPIIGDKLSHISTKQGRLLFLILSIITGILLFYPVFNYQGLIFDARLDGLVAQGDHGSNLYAVQAALRGELPYRDYHWYYGPLMPYYYGFFYQCFGMNIQSILLGKIFLILVSGVLVYWTLTLITSPSFSFLGAFLSFIFCQDFQHSYNHIGATTLLLAIMLCVFLYIHKHKMRYLYCAMGLLFLTSMVKLNIGVFSMVAFIPSIFIINRFTGRTFSDTERRSYTIGLLLTAFCIVIVYFLLLKGLPLYILRQCFPYMREDHPYNTTIWSAVLELLRFMLENFAHSMSSLMFSTFVGLAMIYAMILFMDEKTSRETKNLLGPYLLIPLVFSLSVLHEFLTSGTPYHSYWSKPFNVLLICILIALFFNRLPKLRKTFCFFLLLVWLIVVSMQRILYIQQLKTPEHFFSHKRARIYVKNDPEWIETVTQVTQYMDDHLKKGERFLALPYEPLYYYLTDRIAGSRQLIIFEETNISREQERVIISNLEKHNINYILLSNRAYSLEGSLGLFGQTYGLLLAEYLFRNFRVVESFGDTSRHPGWAGDHAVTIYKRILIQS